MDGIAVDTQIAVALGIPSHPNIEIAFGSSVSFLVSEYRRRAPVNTANNNVRHRSNRDTQNARKLASPRGFEPLLPP